MPARSLGESWSWIQGLQTVQEDGECAGSQVAVWVVGKRKHQQRRGGGSSKFTFVDGVRNWKGRAGSGYVLCPVPPVTRLSLQARSTTADTLAQAGSSTDSQIIRASHSHSQRRMMVWCLAGSEMEACTEMHADRDACRTSAARGGLPGPQAAADKNERGS
jgi:hypothetical protein